MLKLKNIKRTDHYIEADYHPENGVEHGRIVIDIISLNTVFEERSPSEPVYGEDIVHAKSALKKLISAVTLPEEKLVMWY